jgi:hypothetical protein
VTIVSPVVPALVGAEVVIAKDQPQYLPLPSLRTDCGKVLVRLEFSAEDLARVLDGGSLYLCFLTFNQPMQPFMAEIAHHADDAPTEILARFGLAVE